MTQPASFGAGDIIQCLFSDGGKPPVPCSPAHGLRAGLRADVKGRDERQKALPGGGGWTGDQWHGDRQRQSLDSS